MWWLGIAQALDGAVSWYGVSNGLLRETNILLTGIVVSPLFIVLKGGIGVWCGKVLKGSRTLKVIIAISFAIALWNLGGLSWSLLG